MPAPEDAVAAPAADGVEVRELGVRRPAEAGVVILAAGASRAVSSRCPLGSAGLGLKQCGHVACLSLSGLQSSRCFPRPPAYALVLPGRAWADQIVLELGCRQFGLLSDLFPRMPGVAVGPRPRSGAGTRLP